jgi:hypothetical protein
LADTATFEGLLTVVVLAIPITFFLTLFFLWLSRRRRRYGGPSEPQPIAGSLYQGLSSPPAARETVERHLEPQPEDADTIIKKIEHALVRGEKTSLSGLYFDLAGAHERLGNDEARMSALRSAAGYGALHGPPLAHAVARLALAETAHQAGDLASACEQWQMARTAFQQGGETEQYARVDKRMRENGCPTDWVLTDF